MHFLSFAFRDSLVEKSEKYQKGKGFDLGHTNLKQIQG